MRTGDHRRFASRPVLIRMVNLRLSGFSVSSLGIIFNCHHSSVQNQCQIYGVVPQEPPVSIERLVSLAFSRWFVDDGELIRRPKSYAEYLKEQQDRENIIRKQSRLV